MNYNCRKKSQSLKLIFTILLLIISSLAYSQNLDKGLVAYYPFNGNANDESGNNRNGIIYGNPQIVDGKIGKAYYFNGIKDRIEIKNCVSDDFTFLVWIKTDCSNSGSEGWEGRQIISNENSFRDPKNLQGRDVMLSVLNNSICLGGEEGNNSGKNIYASNFITDNNWHFIAASHSGNTAAIYIDGKKVIEDKMDLKIESPILNIAHSISDIQDFNFFKGILDEVKIYNKALTQEEILLEYTGNTEKILSYEELTLEKAKQAFIENNYILVLELLKDFPIDDPLYSQAVALMNQAIAKLPNNNTQNFVTVSGDINCGCSKAISGYVIFEDMNTKLSVGKCKITSNGYYCIVLPSGKIYSYYIDSKDFYPSSRIIDFTSLNQSQNYKDNITLVSYEEMKKQQVSVRINNIFFDFNESKLKSESYLELDRMYKYLNDNPEISVEISGHTDNVGSEEYNMSLSNARANAVKDYLVSKGISSSRIITKGYGKSNPVATNDTEEGRQLNRRVEFKILK